MLSPGYCRTRCLYLLKIGVRELLFYLDEVFFGFIYLLIFLSKQFFCQPFDQVCRDLIPLPLHYFSVEGTSFQ